LLNSRVRTQHRVINFHRDVPTIFGVLAISNAAWQEKRPPDFPAALYKVVVPHTGQSSQLVSALLAEMLSATVASGTIQLTTLLCRQGVSIWLAHRAQG